METLSVNYDMVGYNLIEIWECKWGLKVKKALHKRTAIVMPFDI